MPSYSIKKPKVKTYFISFRVDKEKLQKIEKVIAKLKVRKVDFLAQALDNELASAMSKLFK